MSASTQVRDHPLNVDPASGTRPLFERPAWILFSAAMLTLPMLSLRAPGGLTFSDLLFMASVGLVAVDRFRRSVRPLLSIQVAVGLAAVATLLSSVASLAPVESIGVGLRVVYLFAIWQWQIRVLVRDPQRVVTSVRLYLAGCACSATVAIGQAGFGLAVGGVVEWGRTPGLTEHVNDMGGSMAVGAALAAGLVVTGKARSTGVVALLFVGVGLVLSGSVTGMGAAMTGVLVVAFRRLSVRAVGMLAAGAIAVVFVAIQLQEVLPYAADPVARLRETTGGGGTLQARIDTDAYAWSHISHNPWTGVGLDMESGLTVSGGLGPLLQVHNMVLLAWFQGGLLLLAAVVLVVIVAVRTALKRAGDGLGALQDIALGGAVAAIVFAMTAPVLYHRYFWLPMFLSVTIGELSWSSGRLDQPEPSPAVEAAR